MIYELLIDTIIETWRDNPEIYVEGLGRFSWKKDKRGFAKVGFRAGDVARAKLAGRDFRELIRTKHQHLDKPYTGKPRGRKKKVKE